MAKDLAETAIICPKITECMCGYNYNYQHTCIVNNTYTVTGHVCAAVLFTFRTQHSASITIVL